MSKFRAIFVHGGPGLNSEPDRRVLEPHLGRRGIECLFWNEPSKLRAEGDAFEPAGAFGGWIRSLESAVDGKGPFDVMIASSFGALGALHLLKRRPGAFRRVAMVAPVLDLFTTYKKMISLAEADFQASSPGDAERLVELGEAARAFDDDAMREAMALVNQDAALPLHYFASKEKLSLWTAGFAVPGFGVDPEGRDAVVADLRTAGDPWPAGCLDVSLALLAGAHDPVGDTARWEEVLRKHFRSVEVTCFLKSGHFPHIEEPEAFLDALERFVARS